MTQRMPDYQVSGQGALSVYLLNGVYGSKEMWRYLTRRIVARGYRVVAWDAPGYGISPLPADFSFDVVAEAGAALVRATGTEKNVVFGQSMGAQIAPRIRMKAAGLVHGLVISSTMGYFGNRTPEEQEEFTRKRTKASLDTDSVATNQAVIDSLRGKASTGPEVEYVRQVAAQTPPETVKAAVEAIRTYPAAEAVAAYRAIDVPTIVVAGGDDESAPPPTMRRIADLIPDSEFFVVPGSGHYPWAENPAAFDEYFFDFLERHFGASR